MRILLTGATGLVGSALLPKLMREYPDARVTVLVRSPERWSALMPALAAALGDAQQRVSALRADLRTPRLGLTAAERAGLGQLDLVIHSGADVSFSRALPDARAVNTEGTRRMIALAEETHAQRFVYVSTAFVAGRRTGTIGAELVQPRDGWVNAYEQSKFEAETLVRASTLPWVVFRPGIIVCDDLSGRVTQYNSVHRALHLCYSGLAAMLSGAEDTLVDLVTADFVATAIAQLALRPQSQGQAYHLCAGAHAIRLGELLDRCFTQWSRDEAWRRRSIPRPALTDLRTYNLFELGVQETADARLRVITRALGHFAPQLCYGKLFDTGSAELALGYAAPSPQLYWDAMIERLRSDHWTNARSAA